MANDITDPLSVRTSICIDFKDGTSSTNKFDLMDDLANAFYAIMGEGQNKFSGDGEYHNHIESFDISWDSNCHAFHLDAAFKSGTAQEFIQDMKDDTYNAIDAIFDAGNYNGDSEFYDAVDGYQVLFI